MAGEHTDRGKEAIIAVLPNEHAMTIKMLSNYLCSCLSVWREKLLSGWQNQNWFKVLRVTVQ